MQHFNHKTLMNFCFSNVHNVYMSRQPSVTYIFLIARIADSSLRKKVINDVFDIAVLLAVLQICL